MTLPSKQEALKEMKQKGLIYLVDDEPEILDILESILGPFGFSIKKFLNGKAAFENIKSDRPDVIISDIKMPKMNGIEFLKNCREKKIKTPVIFISGHVNKDILLECINLGTFAFIEKPFDPINTISTCLQAVDSNLSQVKISKSIKSFLYQFNDLDRILELHGEDNIRKSLKVDFHIFQEQIETFRRTNQKD
jgi:DNA-binding NtrC family response regulator